METGAVEVVLALYAALALGLLYAGRRPTGAEATIKAEMTARKLGIALPLCAALATLVSMKLWKPDGIVGFLEFGIAVAVAPCLGAAFAIWQLGRGRRAAWSAYVYFGAALVGLLFLLLATALAVSNW
jgi:hypothetical protein